MSIFGETASELAGYEIGALEDRVRELKETNHKYVGRIIELECAIKWLVNEALKIYDDEQPVKKGMRKILEQGSIPPLDPKEIKV
jgi:transposase